MLQDFSRCQAVLGEVSHQSLSPISQFPFPYPKRFVDWVLLEPGITGLGAQYSKRGVAYLEDTLAGLPDSH
jgi:hypothetical protein